MAHHASLADTIRVGRMTHTRDGIAWDSVHSFLQGGISGAQFAADKTGGPALLMTDGSVWAVTTEPPDDRETANPYDLGWADVELFTPETV